MWRDIGRWDTVNEMLAALSPQEFVEARAAYETVPLDDGWRQTGTVAAAINNKFEKLFAINAGRSSIDSQNIREPQDYIPKVKFKKDSELRVNQASIDAYQQTLEQQYRY